MEFPGATPEVDGALSPGAPDEPGKDQHYYLQAAWDNFREGEFEPALLNFSKALRFDSGMIEAWEGQVRCLIELGELREAEVWANKALGLFPKNPGLLSVKAYHSALTGSCEEALDLSDQALLQPFENKPFMWYDRGAILLLKDSGETARLTLEKILEENPNDWFWLLHIGQLYFKTGKFAIALDLWQKASQHAPALPYLWYKIGQCYQAMGNQPKAKQAFERALEAKANYKPAQEALLSLNKKSCFVATCLELDPERLDYLRGLRDSLRQQVWGETLWQLYLKISPPLVNILLRYPRLKLQGRKALSHLVDHARLRLKPPYFKFQRSTPCRQKKR